MSVSLTIVTITTSINAINAKEIVLMTREPVIFIKVSIII